MVQHTSETSGHPTLSVVVPIYNVEAYLDECLESVAAQQVQDFEVVMVDDGSTDSSGQIAARWAASDSRYKLVTQPNGGLGHARNTGAKQATGKYLAFLDSDDAVPEDSYRRMIDTLEETGSDFATGNVHRYDSTGRTWQAPLYKGLVKGEKRATHVSRSIELLRDHLAPNKVWRTAFWREADIQFPVDVLYEDVPTIVPAHVRAKSVDVVPVVVVHWRVRDRGDSSITQQRNRDAVHVRDRVDAVLTVSDYIAEHATQSLKDDYDFLVMRRDLRWYVDLYPEVDEEYRAELFSSIKRFLDQVSPEALRRTPVAMRIAYALLGSGNEDDFAAYVAMRLAGQVDDLPVHVEDGRAVVEIDLPGQTPLSADDRDITDELKLPCRVSDVDISGDALVIKGWAALARLPIGDTSQQVKVWLRGNRRSLVRRTVAATVTYRRDLRAAAELGADAEASGCVAFTATIPARKLKRRRWLGLSTEWVAKVSVTSSGISKIRSLAKPLTGKAERPLLVPLGKQWLRVCWKGDVITCRMRPEPAILDDVTTTDGGEFKLSLRTTPPATRGAAVRLRATDGSCGANYPVRRTGRDRAEVRIPSADLPGIADGAQAWNLLYRTWKRGGWQRVLDPKGAFGHAVTSGDTETVLWSTGAATLRLTRGEPAPAVVGASWTDHGSLAIRMHAQTNVDAIVLKARGQNEEHAFDVTAGTELSADLTVAALARFGDHLPIRAGTWDIVARGAAGDVAVRIGAELVDTLPAAHNHHGRKYTLTDRRRQNLSLVVETDLAHTERGAINQRRLRTAVYPLLKTGLRDAVLYESYFGKQFSDSPRDIFAELSKREVELEHLIVVRDQQVMVPEGATAVPYRSEEYFAALAQARVVVSNSHLPGCFERADGQTVLQTWHGVGTKKIGLDMTSIHFANKSYLDNIRNGETDHWNYLISPNPFTSPILRRAFAFRGTLLETGVPRNDVFHRPDRDEVASKVKQRLGIPEDRKIVMYAPTWRDNLHNGPGRYRLDLRFDLHEAARKLGDDYAILFRKHSNVVDRLPTGTSGVIDASDYPEVQELLLVTDVLISDYSTLMCDFANTGRPMLFYTYDLANYRDVLRGFYFDFEAEVPGPLITDEADLVPAILDADRIRADHSGKYDAFAQRFCPWDDGRAAERVVDAVFGTA